jgi:hypothetical protein
MWVAAVPVTAVSLEGESIVTLLADDTRHVHSRRGRGWHVDFVTSGARSSIDLGGARDEPTQPPAAVGLYGDATTGSARSPSNVTPIRRARRLTGAWLADCAPDERDTFHTFALGEPHYRRSEESWQEAGAPTATVTLAWTGSELHVEVDVRKAAEPLFVAFDAVNPYDNERPDINGDGLQLYLKTPDSSGAWVLVPEPRDAAVRVRAIPGWGELAVPRATWRRTSGGYLLHVVVRVCDGAPEAPIPIELDAIVNESAMGRERRRGQLVLSGAAGEFVYLAGDRHDPARLLPFVLEP